MEERRNSDELLNTFIGEFREFRGEVRNELRNLRTTKSDVDQIKGGLKIAQWVGFGGFLTGIGALIKAMGVH